MTARDEGGQIVVVVALLMAVMLGLGAMAIDVGSWFRAQRQLQTSVDAGALAAAQDLPAVTGVMDAGSAAKATATAFITQNGTINPDPLSTSVTVTTPAPTGTGCSVDNCIAVDGSRSTSGLLARALGAAFSSISMHVRSQAFVGPPSLAKNVSSAAVSSAEVCTVAAMPCHTTLNFDLDGFTLLDLNSANSVRTAGGNVSANQMKTWISTGDPNALPIDKYYGETNGSKNGLKNAFPADGTTKMLIPVYQAGTFDPLTGTLYVIGFAAFVVDKNSVTGSTWDDSGSGHHTLTGTFVRFIAQGLPSGPGTGTSFGVFAVGLDG